MIRSGEWRSRCLQSSMRPNSQGKTIFPRSDSYCYVASNRSVANLPHRDVNLRKPTLYGVVVGGPLSEPGGRFVRKGLRRAKPVIRSGALVTVGFFNLYLAVHYIRLALAQEYGTSPLDKITCLILLPLAFLFLQDRRSWLPVSAMLGYGAVLMLGAIIFPRGVPRPISAIVTIALDFRARHYDVCFCMAFQEDGQRDAGI